MPNFWSHISNGKYSVGCTGQTVYVYDSNGTELAKFKDLIYAYDAAFSPKGDIFVVKSTEGRLAVYSLDELRLIKKFRFSKVDGAQDDGFCFSPDGEKFYNIERHIDSCKTALSIYLTKDFTLEKRLFSDDFMTVLTAIEYDINTDTCFLLGFFRSEEGPANSFFVAKLYDDKLTDIIYLPQKEYHYHHFYKNLESRGFTEKSKYWSPLKSFDIELDNIESKKESLAKLWQSYKS